MNFIVNRFRETRAASGVGRWVQRFSVYFKSTSSNRASNSAAGQSRFTSDNISLCVIGNGAEGNPRSLILDYNERLFMFNCGEGLQRIIPDFGYKSSKVERLFITSNHWQNVSGLSSFLLGRFDANVKEIDITGLDCENITTECIRFDTKLKRVKYNYLDCKSGTNFTFDRLRIKSVVFESQQGKSIVYLANLSEKKGLINLEKCFKLRVPRNMVSNLEKGLSVTLENGNIIFPSDVLSPNQPDKHFIVFESVDLNSIKNLENNIMIHSFLQEKCDCIVHFTKDIHLQLPEYKRFLEKYSSTFHLLITESNQSLCLYSAHRFQTQLNYIDSKIFPMLSESNVFNEEKNSTNPLLINNKRVVYCQAGLQFNLTSTPVAEEDLITFDKIPQLNLFSKQNAILHKDGSHRLGLTETIEALRLSQKEIIEIPNQNYPEFIFLGTASSLSLPIRNVSSILVNLSPRESILLDCGENTYGQLLRFYGKLELEQILDSLKAVFISHHHSDHHMGLVEMMEKHHSLTGNKLFFILPPMVSKFLHSKSLSFSSLNNLKLKYDYSINRQFDWTKSSLSRLLPSLKRIDLIPVNHCAFAYGIAVTCNSDFKFIYSGDTQPCNTLIKEGLECDLLIHEATVEDSLIKFARTHFHSTISEAVDVGRLMKARFTILTHFSQRYGKLPLFADDKAKPSVALAFDNMRVSAGEFLRLPLMYDALKCMYSKHLEQLEIRSELYNRKYNK